MFTGRIYLPSFRKDGPISNTLSNPPRISLLSHSSGAIRSVICRPWNSVAEVWNGLAIAPPAVSASIGVWTSMCPSRESQRRRKFVISDLSRTVSANRGLSRKSTCRFRIFVSLSVSCSGSDCRQGDNICGSSVASTDSSFLSVL